MGSLHNVIDFLILSLRLKLNNLTSWS